MWWGRNRPGTHGFRGRPRSYRFRGERKRMRGLRYCIAVVLAFLSTAPLRAQTSTGTVRGRVTDGATLQPLAGVTVSVRSHAAVTLADGRYLITNVPAGSESVPARPIGYAPAAHALPAAGRGTGAADFTRTAQAIRLSHGVVLGDGG